MYRQVSTHSSNATNKKIAVTPISMHEHAFDSNLSNCVSGQKCSIPFLSTHSIELNGSKDRAAAL
jgi:hypothetical protein